MKKNALILLCSTLVLMAGIGCKSKKTLEASDRYPIDNQSGYDFYYQAQDAFDNKEYEKASFYYKKFTEDPEVLGDSVNLSIVYNSWANVLNQLSKETKNIKYAEEALKKIEKATLLDSTRYIPYMNWGMLLSEYGRAKNDNKKILAQSIKKFKKSAEINPFYSKTNQELASNLVYLGILKKNKTLITESIEYFGFVSNRGADYYNNYGIALLSLADLNKSIYQNKKAIEESFNKAYALGSTEVLSGLATLHAKTGNTDEALRCLEIYFQEGNKLTKKEIKTDFKNIRKDKRFKTLLKKYNKQ